VIDGVVLPSVHKYEKADEEVKITVGFDVFNVVEPLGVITGTVGEFNRLTVVTAEDAEQFGPLKVLTVYGPAAFTMIERVVAPFDQR
jgi:hypothetical protein